ncbi:MAG: hypothetical protein P4L93_01400 [Coriobacteriia bacterium]|nr:hypothetical protein [Coriobacteriia bacterium]
MPEGNEKNNVDQVLRALVSASRSLRLYPAASPIPRQSVEAVIAALANVFERGVTALPVSVAREGFSSGGESVGVGMPGGVELADDLRSHGVSMIEFESAVTGDDLLTMLVTLSRHADEVRAEGGFSEALAAAGAHNINVSEILLTVIDSPSSEGELGSGIGDGAAAELAADPDKLGAWLTSVGADPGALKGGLLSISGSVGAEGTGELATAMSSAFPGQPVETRDALLGLAMEAGPFRDLMGEMLRRQSAAEVASSILGGTYGRNMLSLSTALTSLPLEQLDEAVQAQIHAMLPEQGHTDSESKFLDHMIDVRRRKEAEPALISVDHTYAAVVQASTIKANDIETASRAVQASTGAIDAASVRTMFTLLDQATDAEHTHASAESLVKMVPGLVCGGQIALADYILAQLAARSDRVKLAELTPAAATAETLAALVSYALLDADKRVVAERIIRALGEPAAAPLVAAAVNSKGPGLAFAEGLLGKRMIEPLNAVAFQAQWFQLCDIVARLAAEGDARSTATVEALMRRPEAPARKEIVSGLTTAGGPTAGRLLAEMVRDPNEEVALAAAQGLAKARIAGAGSVISARLSELDIDHADYELAREFIGVLARIPDPAAAETLDRLASRRAIIKRGHFNDIQAAVAAAQQLRAREAVSR